MQMRISKSRLAPALMALLAALLLASCKGDPEFGKITLDITDAPVDHAQKVVLQVNGITLTPEHGDPEIITFDQPKSINLLATATTGAVHLLDNESVPALVYKNATLDVAAESNTMDSYIQLDDGSKYSLKLGPSYQGQISSSGVMVVPVQGSSRFTIDFDLRRSIRPPASSGDPDYIIQPALRLLDNDSLGTVTGTVDPSLVVSGCVPVVYFYGAQGITLGDINSANDGLPPYSTIIPALDSQSGDYVFEGQYFHEGNYTAAFTCDGDKDDVEDVNTLDFTAKTTFELRRDSTVSISLKP